jgi:microcin C transport system substrate-binding protein
VLTVLGLALAGAAAAVPPAGGGSEPADATQAAPRAAVARQAAVALADAGVAATTSQAGGVAGNDAPVWRHGIAYFDEFRYPPDFTHFDWVNVDAPKGGRIVLPVLGSFNSFNALIPRGLPATGLTPGVPSNWLYDSLLERTTDELNTHYGRLAERVLLAPDFRAVTFVLRADARWHDGVPVTAGDMAFAFATIQRHGTPTLKTMFKEVTGVDVLDAHTIRFRMSGNAPKNPGLALLVGSLHPLPEHYWRTRDVSRTTLEPPLGSGPYRIGRFVAGRAMEFERVDDYWGRDIPVNRGRFNFDVIRYEYFLDRNVMIETQKAGDLDARVEGYGMNWAYSYDIDAVRKGLLRKQMVPITYPYGLGWSHHYFNLREPRFRDVRVREALALAVDFDWANRVLYYDFYARSGSFFSGTPMQSQGLPDADELALLEPFRDQVPPRVFSEAYATPGSSGIGVNRDALLRADALLEQAGWVVRDGIRVNAATGERMAIDFIYNYDGGWIVGAPYFRSLERLGIAVRARKVEAAQYLSRMRTRDFDATYENTATSLIPGTEFWSAFSSEAADIEASTNRAGITDPVVDALLRKVLSARSERELRAAGRALDRVLLWNFYAVPGFYPAGMPYIWWDRFGIPEVQGEYRWSFPDAWWFDEAKAARVARNLGSGQAPGS